MVYEPQYFENHAQDSRVTGPHDVGNTVSANYGMGGGNTPIVGQPFRKVRRAKSDTDFETWEEDDKANTLNCFDQGDVRSTNVVAQPISWDSEVNCNINKMGTIVRGGQGGRTDGVAQPIAYSFDSLSSNSMKSSNPHSGCREVDTSKTIDTTTPEPSKNQGGIAIAQPIPIHDQATRFQGKRGDKQDGKGNGLGIGNEGDVMNTLTKADKHAVAQPIAVDTYNPTINENTNQTLRSPNGAVQEYIGAVLEQTSVGALCARDYKGVGNQYVDEGKCITSPVTMAIRRLTPKECERLQGFPDDWTRIPYRNKPADQCPDGPRYKACGNSMAVPVMRWIGQRIEYIEALMKEL
jgi:DNA (cytosine-5)-methyltransferase 1